LAASPDRAVRIFKAAIRFAFTNGLARRIGGGYARRLGAYARLWEAGAVKLLRVGISAGEKHPFWTLGQNIETFDRAFSRRIKSAAKPCASILTETAPQSGG
jgi:hypothetical protein